MSSDTNSDTNKKRKMEKVDSIMLKIRDEVTGILSTRVPEAVLFNLVYLFDHESDDPDVMSAVFVCHRDRAAELEDSADDLFEILVRLLNIRAYYTKDCGNIDPEDSEIDRFEECGVILLTLNRQSSYEKSKRVVYHRSIHCPPPLRCQSVVMTWDDLPEGVLDAIRVNEADWDAQQKAQLEE